MIKVPILTTLGGVIHSRTTRVIGGASASKSVVNNLFNNGEKGFFYDPLNLGSLLQDIFGRLPVTLPNQNISLILDTKKGINFNTTTVADLGFNDSASWFNTDVWTVGNGVASGVGVNKGLYQGNKIVAGKLYKATLTVDLISGALNLPYDGYPSNSSQITTSGTYTRYFFGTLTNFYAAFGVNFTGSISNLNIVEVDGNHAYQSVLALQPTYQITPKRVSYGVGTKLATTLTEVLTGCTIVRAIPNVGTQILTNQVLNTLVEDTTNHCGFLAINRALTPTETTAITLEFNKRAGV